MFFHRPVRAENSPNFQPHAHAQSVEQNAPVAARRVRRGITRSRNLITYPLTGAQPRRMSAIDQFLRGQ